MPPLKHVLVILILVVQHLNSLQAQTVQYIMPAEDTIHEGTWLTWPHQYSYGISYRDALDTTWINMTAALVGSEKVHIVAYDSTEKNRIQNLLSSSSVSLSNVDFFIHQTDDVWIRDNGPVFVYDTLNNLTILDWGFNGWGLDYAYALDDPLPIGVSTDIGIPQIDLNAMELEGGAIEIDGNGVMIATKSSITHSSRNPGLTQLQIENYLTTYMGVTKFIWLNGVYGLEVTDMHIDGFVKFANDSTIVTMNSADLFYWYVSLADRTTLYAATDVNGNPYNFVYLPLTMNDVVTTNGTALGYKGSYINYYIANNVVLVPNYNDPNDAPANAILQGLYPGKTVVGIDVRNLYENGGMVHCVTQQQPVGSNTLSFKENKPYDFELKQNMPNPFSDHSTISFALQTTGNIHLQIINNLGIKLKDVQFTNLQSGEHSIDIDAKELESGIYTYTVTFDNSIQKSKHFIVQK